MSSKVCVSPFIVCTQALLIKMLKFWQWIFFSKIKQIRNKMNWKDNNNNYANVFSKNMSVVVFVLSMIVIGKYSKSKEKSKKRRKREKER